MTHHRILDVLAYNIDRLLDEQGLSNKDIYTNTSLSESYVSRLRHAKENPTIMKLAELADFFGVPCYQLFLQPKSEARTH